MVQLDPRYFRLAGACLARSLARSEYLRRRGIEHAIVIGVAGPVEEFAAHAWIAPFEVLPEGFTEFRRVAR